MIEKLLLCVVLLAVSFFWQMCINEKYTNRVHGKSYCIKISIARSLIFVFGATIVIYLIKTGIRYPICG